MLRSSNRKLTRLPNGAFALIQSIMSDLRVGLLILLFSCSSRIRRNHSPTLITVRCSFSTFHCKLLSQTLLPCYPSACSSSSILAGLSSRADLCFLSMSWLTAVHRLSKPHSWSGYPASPEHLGALGWSSSTPF